MRKFTVDPARLRRYRAVADAATAAALATASEMMELRDERRALAGRKSNLADRDRGGPIDLELDRQLAELDDKIKEVAATEAENAAMTNHHITVRNLVDKYVEPHRGSAIPGMTINQAGGQAQ